MVSIYLLNFDEYFHSLYLLCLVSEIVIVLNPDYSYIVLLSCFLFCILYMQYRD